MPLKIAPCVGGRRAHKHKHRRSRRGVSGWGSVRPGAEQRRASPIVCSRSAASVQPSSAPWRNAHHPACIQLLQTSLRDTRPHAVLSPVCSESALRVKSSGAAHPFPLSILHPNPRTPFPAGLTDTAAPGPSEQCPAGSVSGQPWGCEECGCSGAMNHHSSKGCPSSTVPASLTGTTDSCRTLQDPSQEGENNLGGQGEAPHLVLQHIQAAECHPRTHSPSTHSQHHGGTAGRGTAPWPPCSGPSAHTCPMGTAQGGHSNQSCWRPLHPGRLLL